MVANLVQACRRQLEAGGEQTGPVPPFHECGELVDGEKVLDPVAELLSDIARVVRKRLGRVAGFPATDTVLKRLRQVPVIERRERLDAVGEQLVHQAAVEVQPFQIWSTNAFRENAWPRD